MPSVDPLAHASHRPFSPTAGAVAVVLAVGLSAVEAQAQAQAQAEPGLRVAETGASPQAWGAGPSPREAGWLTYDEMRRQLAEQGIRLPPEDRLRLARPVVPGAGPLPRGPVGGPGAGYGCPGWGWPHCTRAMPGWGPVGP